MSLQPDCLIVAEDIYSCEKVLAFNDLKVPELNQASAMWYKKTMVPKAAVLKLNLHIFK